MVYNYFKKTMQYTGCNLIDNVDFLTAILHPPPQTNYGYIRAPLEILIEKTTRQSFLVLKGTSVNYQKRDNFTVNAKMIIKKLP